MAMPSMLHGLSVGSGLEPIVRPLPWSAIRIAATRSDDLESSRVPTDLADRSVAHHGHDQAEAVDPSPASDPVTGVVETKIAESIVPIRPAAERGREPGSGGEGTIVGPSAASGERPDHASGVVSSGEGKGVEVEGGLGIGVNFRGDGSCGVAALVGPGTLGSSLTNDGSDGLVISEPSTTRAVPDAPAEPEVADVARKKSPDPIRSTGPVSRREVTEVAATGSFASWSAMSVEAAMVMPPALPVTPDEIESVERPVETPPVWIQGRVSPEEPAAEADDTDDQIRPEGSRGGSAISKATVPVPGDGPGSDVGSLPAGPSVEVIELAVSIAAATELTEERAPRFEPAREEAAKVEPELAAELLDRTTDETVEHLAQHAATAERRASGAIVSSAIGVPPSVATAADRNPPPDLLSLVAMTPKARRRPSSVTGAGDTVTEARTRPADNPS